MSVIVLSDNEYEEERYLHPQGLQDNAFDEVYHIMRERSPEVAEDVKWDSVSNSVGSSNDDHPYLAAATSGMSYCSQPHDQRTALTETYLTVPVAPAPAVPAVWPSVPIVPQAQVHHVAGPANANARQQRELVHITVPQDANSRRRLAVSYHDEILHDWIQDTLRESGIHDANVTADDIHSMEIQDALSNHGRVHGRPYLLCDHFLRHDWNPRTHNCVYTVQTPTGRHRGSAEGLEERFSGVRYAVWSYWGARGNVRRHNIQRYVETFGLHSFYATLMWPWLDDEVWLALWRNRRDSRRV
jgi:hypothetical protein